MNLQSHTKFERPLDIVCNQVTQPWRFVFILIVSMINSATLFLLGYILTIKICSPVLGDNL